MAKVVYKSHFLGRQVVRITRALYKQIQHAALDADETVLGWIDKAIIERIERHEKEKPPASPRLYQRKHQTGLRRRAAALGRLAGDRPG